VWAQLEVAEELIATTGSGLSVTQALMTRFPSLTRRQARAYQAAVARRWQLESRQEERSQRLERYRRTLEQVIKQGFERKATVCIDRKEDEWETVPQPDLKAVTAATAILIRMDGGEQPASEEPRVGMAIDASKPAIVVSSKELSEAIAARRKQESET